ITGSVDKITKLSGVKIYPNPNKGNFTITVEDPKADIAISIYNLLGEVVKTIQTSSLKSVYSIDLNEANGVYLVKVTNGGLTSTQKVTINK
ncbi:MAG: T9SS type A sorting domain-containing protein, partial [Bacteroidia bacterium]|nr:T9SS type A sorting domain-containing protein [Bacteroidia bacterium]